MYKDKDWLYQKYIVEKLSSGDIAKICNCSDETIRKWLIKFYIKRRPPCKHMIGKQYGKNNPNYSPLKKRLWKKVNKKDNISECWEWNGYKTRDGHGHIGGEDSTKIRQAHAVTYEIFYKVKIEKDEVVHHMCDNPSCCNPFHLIKMKKGEHSRLHSSGEKCSKAKLIWKDVQEIRKKYNGKRGEIIILAKKYKVHASTVSDIVNNKTWKT